MPKTRIDTRAPVHVPAGEGRRWPMGPLEAVFLADEGETQGKYAISEWWLEPHTRGPGAHQHPEDDAFYVLEGTMSFRIGDRWIDAEKGAFVMAPGGTLHDFENRTARRAGALNISVPGDFEPNMAGIAGWFRGRSAADARTDPALDLPSTAPAARAPGKGRREPG